MADTQWLTQAQYDLLANELKERVEVKRVEIARLIDAARQEGDLRENGGRPPPPSAAQPMPR